MRIVLTGGGTAGHLFPIIAVAREIKKIAQQKSELVEFMFIGPKTIGQEELTKEAIANRQIMAGKLRRYASLQNIFDIFKIPAGILQALWILFFFMPNAVFSKGGYGSVPVVIAAWIYRIPVLIHESDATPGLANKFAAKFSKRVAVSFLDSAKYFPTKKTAVTGNPVRDDIFNGSKEEAKRIFGITDTKPVLLVLGGSQGAQPINDIIFASLIILLQRYEIIHQCGEGNLKSFKQLISGEKLPGFFLYPFLNGEQLRHAFAAADLVISRAGAGTIAEIAALGKPSITIPLPNSAADHQTKNYHNNR